MAAALSLASAGAQAAGLGKITILSQLGQPLRAELEVTASREELGSLSARVAPHDAFKQVGVEFAPILTAVRFAVDKRPDGRPIIRMTTERPVNDPFLDVLVELTWTSGRMVREYTVLLDPPAEVQRPPVAATPLPVTRVPPVAVTPPPAPAEAAPPAAASVPAAAAPAPSGEGRVVKAGDTLAKIARETRPEGISLDQMLVALFRGNPDAFAGKNMNRLKTGRILSIPDAVAVAEIPAQEARQLVVSQTADFNAYRQRLASTVAAAPVPEEAPKQEAVGKIAPKVEEKAPAPAAGTDKLQVSRTETQKAAADKQLQGRVTALEEDLVARERSLKEANSRIAELEKNLSDMKKLAELKSQAGAQMQKQAEVAKAPEPAKTPEPAKAPAPVAKAPEPVPTPAAEPAKAEAPAEKPAPAAEAKPVAKPQPPKKPAAPPPPPAPEPSFLEENALLVYGGGGVLALLLGYLGFNTWKRKREVAVGGPTTSRISEGDLTANSVFGTTGGQAVDTGASIQTDFSQSSLGAIDADEGVDPVAEADVYMAYGRDAQAEEILIDALKNDPARHAIHLKLLEIYAARKSLKQFEELATDLHGQTGGTGPNWEKAAALGLSVDPENPLYGGGGAAPAAEGLSPLPDLAATTVILPPAGSAAAAPAEKLQDTVTLPGQLAQMAATAEAPAPAPAAELDFDLGVEPPPAAEVEAPAIDTTALDFDLDLGAPAAEPSTPPKAELRPDDMTHLTLDLASPELADMGEASEPTHINVEGRAAAPEPAEPSLDFEFDLGLEEAPAAGVPPVAPAPRPALDLDLTAADLELGALAEAPSAAEGEDNPDVATKLELAQAYEEMGDKEGARELLQEVVNEGSPRQQEVARGKLAALDA